MMRAKSGQQGEISLLRKALRCVLDALATSGGKTVAPDEHAGTVSAMKGELYADRVMRECLGIAL